MPTQALHRHPAPTATDRWFHYDQVGSVMATTNASGALSELRHPDAFGNRMASWQSGLWTNTYAERKGWGHNRKEFDADIGLVYMYRRWYNSELGLFGSKAPYGPMVEHPYGFVQSFPTNGADPKGTIPTIVGGDPFQKQMLAQAMARACGKVDQVASPGILFDILVATGEGVMHPDRDGEGASRGLDIAATQQKAKCLSDCLKNRCKSGQVKVGGFWCRSNVLGYYHTGGGNTIHVCPLAVCRS